MQPLRADVAADFFVIGEVKLERAAKLEALRNRGIEREQRPRISGEIRLRHRHAAPEHDAAVRAVFDHRTIGVDAPSEAGRHDIAVGIERDDRAVAEAVAHDQIGRALHADRLDGGARHGMCLDLQA